MESRLILYQFSKMAVASFLLRSTTFPALARFTVPGHGFALAEWVLSLITVSTSQKAMVFFFGGGAIYCTH